ncbi:MAG: N-6 DNA methylase [Candidatus Heimdallarchaeota archaeon]|nr:MAG: N-6 DNA methylase [Candidatus Heimdallarchaeota archaeon]
MESTTQSLENKFQLIINSIPINFNKKLTSIEQKQLSWFSEATDIPLDSLDTFRQLTALLILNRLRFIALYGEGLLDSKTIYASYQTTSDLLKQTYPRIFIPSILDSIANLSSLIISSSLLKFDKTFLNQSTKIVSSLYLEVVNQKFRRKMGQFWTPEYIAELMIELALQNDPRNILDPCTGPGTFIHTLKRVSPDYYGKISAIELHPLLYEIASVNLHTSSYQMELKCGDFLTSHSNSFALSIHDILALTSPGGLDSYIELKSNGFDSIVCNPPYSRHHVLSSKIKAEVGGEIESAFGARKFSRISSLFMYFILKSLKLLIRDGRMVFVTPTISFESRNSIYLKKILKDWYRVPYIIVFHHSMNIFSGVDTAACIFVVEGKRPKSTDVTKLLIVKKWTSKEKILNYLKIESNEAFRWTEGGLYNKRQIDLDPERNWTRSEAFLEKMEHEKLTEISTFFKVMRGIATGRNSFFTFNEDELSDHQIDSKFVVPTLTKTRYVQKYLFSKEDFISLKEEKRKSWLLYIQQELNMIKDQNLLNYLELGLNQNVHSGSLVKTRKFWYQTEKREIPYFIYTYLSRGNPRFILNEAEVRPLNTFLMIYPKREKNLSKEILTLFWVIFNSNSTFDSLRNVGRCYGGDTLKLEPTELMKAWILNPFTITTKSKKKLLKLARKLRSINTKDEEVRRKIDAIIEEEL